MSEKLSGLVFERAFPDKVRIGHKVVEKVDHELYLLFTAGDNNNNNYTNLGYGIVSQQGHKDEVSGTLIATGEATTEYFRSGEFKEACAKFDSLVNPK